MIFHTSEDVHVDGHGLSQAGRAGVDAGIRRPRVLHHQIRRSDLREPARNALNNAKRRFVLFSCTETHLALLGDHAHSSARRIVRYYLRRERRGAGNGVVVLAPLVHVGEKVDILPVIYGIDGKLTIIWYHV